MPVERIAGRGEKTLLFGPLKPKGLTNPRTGKRDYAGLCSLDKTIKREDYII